VMRWALYQRVSQCMAATTSVYMSIQYRRLFRDVQ